MIKIVNRRIRKVKGKRPMGVTLGMENTIKNLFCKIPLPVSISPKIDKLRPRRMIKDEICKPVNILKNGGFESGDLSDWESEGEACIGFNVTDEISHNGKYALSIGSTCTVGDYEWADIYQDYIKLDPRKKLSMTAWIQPTEQDDDAAEIAIDYYDMAENLIKEDVYHLDYRDMKPGDWNEMKMDVTVPSDTYDADVWVSNLLNGKSSVLIDDVVLVYA